MIAAVIESVFIFQDLSCRDLWMLSGTTSLTVSLDSMMPCKMAN